MPEKKLKVCHITSMHTWDDDRIYERACIGLAQLGFDVSLISSPLSLNKGAEAGLLFKDGESKNGVTLYWLKMRSGLKRRIFSSRQAMRKAVKLNPDIIHFHDPDIMPWAYLYSFFYKGAIVCDIHENYSSRIQNLNLSQGIKNFLAGTYRNFEKLVIRRIKGFVTTTETMKELYAGVSTPGIAVSNVPFLKRLEDMPVITGKNIEVTVITSGTHADSRNCMETVDAMPLVLKKYPDVRFKFVGRYQPKDYNEKLLQRAKELNVAHAISVEGMQPWLENFERVAKAHIGCVFYADNLNNRVTIPNRLFEYMAMGLAIIGEDFPEVSKVISNARCGVTVNSQDPVAISDGLCEILKDPGNLRQMGENGKAAVKNLYNFENELKKLSFFYKEIIN